MCPMASHSTGDWMNFLCCPLLPSDWTYSINAEAAPSIGTLRTDDKKTCCPSNSSHLHFEYVEIINNTVLLVLPFLDLFSVFCVGRFDAPSSTHNA